MDKYNKPIDQMTKQELTGYKISLSKRLNWIGNYKSAKPYIDEYDRVCEEQVKRGYIVSKTYPAVKAY